MAYFEFSAKKFDPPSKEGKDAITQKSANYHRNMTTFRVNLDIFAFDSLRTIFYTVSWILKFIAYKILSSSWTSNRIGKASCYIIWISQKVHMILVNSIAMDLIPYSIRTLFQSKNLPFWKHVWSLALLILLVYDFLEIEFLGGRAIIQEAK